MKVEQYQLKEAVDSHDILFGKHFICTGGKQRISNLIGPYKFSAVMHILDIGCGKGAASLEIAKTNDVYIDAVDNTGSFIQEAIETCVNNDLTDKVNFYHSDILGFTPSKTYDLVFSIDTFLHIHKKK